MGVPEIEGREGRAYVEVLRHVDEKFAKACEEGIMLEILSHELVTNEGRGCEAIQAAANSNNAVALTHHEMEIVSSSSKWCSKLSAVAAHMTSASARGAMIVTYPTWRAARSS